LFWFARRDLAARAAPASADTQELEQLCETLEALVTDLAGRLERVERQIAQEVPESLRSKRANKMQVSPVLKEPEPVKEMEPDELPDTRYAPVYALLDEGMTDPQEISRQTGLSRGEVDLILSLRARRAL